MDDRIAEMSDDRVTLDDLRIYTDEELIDLSLPALIEVLEGAGAVRETRCVQHKHGCEFALQPCDRRSYLVLPLED